jgi:hypothetical protein
METRNQKEILESLIRKDDRYRRIYYYYNNFAIGSKVSWDDAFTYFDFNEGMSPEEFDAEMWRVWGKILK